MSIQIYVSYCSSCRRMCPDIAQYRHGYWAAVSTLHAASDRFSRSERPQAPRHDTGLLHAASTIAATDRLESQE